MIDIFKMLLDGIAHRGGAGHFRKPPKIYKDLKRRWEANKLASKNSVDSRQQLRARMRAEAFTEINRKYGPEPLHARRGIALTLAHKWYKESRAA